MKPAEAAELFDLMIKYAPRLRDAGIRVVDLSRPSFELGDLPAVPDAVDDDADEDRGLPPLQDSETFGVRPKKKRGNT